MFSRISTTKQMKQELFLIRNNQCTAPPKPTANNSEEALGSSNGRQTAPSVPASRSPSRSTSHTSSSPSGGSQAPPSHARSGDPPPQSTPSTPKVIPPQQIKSKKFLCIGDSISANVDMNALQDATETKIVSAKAYSSIHDTVSNVAKQAAKYPQSNFTDVIPAMLRKDDYECLILQSGSVDITNLNTKDEPSTFIEYFKQEKIMSAKNLFSAACNALKMDPKLLKVVLMKQIIPESFSLTPRLPMTHPYFDFY